MITRRYRIGSDVIPIQEVENLHVVRIYCDVGDISRFVKQKLPEEELEKYADCTFVPIDISWNHQDLVYEMMFVPAK